MATAQEIFDSTPIGARIRYSDGAPRPPARWKARVRAWERQNGVATLTEKHGPGAYTPAHFVLTVNLEWMQVCTIYHLDSRLRFDVVSLPAGARIAS